MTMSTATGRQKSKKSLAPQTQPLVMTLPTGSAKVPRTLVMPVSSLISRIGTSPAAPAKAIAQRKVAAARGKAAAPRKVMLAAAAAVGPQDLSRIYKGQAPGKLGGGRRFELRRQARTEKKQALLSAIFRLRRGRPRQSRPYPGYARRRGVRVLQRAL